MLTLVVFFVVLSVLVLVHEFGHFIVGRWAGIGVLEFALGLPFTKPLWSRKLKSGMHISLYPVLFGGFVKLLGEEAPDGGEKGEGSPSTTLRVKREKVAGKEFYKATVGQRIVVVVAGVGMNLLLGLAAFYVFLALANFRALLPRLSDYDFVSPSQEVIVVSTVVPGSPAEKAGLKESDVILAAGGRTFADISAFQEYVKSQGGQSVQFAVTDLDYASSKMVTVTPRENPPKDQGALGVGIGEAVAVRFDTPAEKLTSGVVYSYDMLAYNIQVLSQLFTKSVETRSAAPVANNVSGPLGILSIVGDILNLPWKVAIRSLVNFLGLLSLSLAFMNILPIPAMDGGRLVFLLFEAISRRKVPARIENWVNQAGMIALLGLIMLISFNDVKKNFLPKCSEPGFLSEAGVCMEEGK